MSRKRPAQLDDAEFLRRRYVQERAAADEIGQEVGASATAVRDALRRHGIPIRVGRPPAKAKPGDRFGMLVVVREQGRKYGHRAYLCRCDCGNEIVTHSPMLRDVPSRSCGCWTWQKLSPAQIEEVRTSTEPINAMARRFGVGRPLVRRHVPDGDPRLIPRRKGPKMTAAQIAEARASSLTQRQIATKYGVSQAAVSRTLSRA